MSALPVTPLAPTLSAQELARLGVVRADALLPSERVLSLDWPELDRLLPDRGLPRGVVELSGRGATMVALAAVRAVHAKDARAFAAWITPEEEGGLYAPGAAQAGVDLRRLLVVRPPRAALARTAVRVATSGAFDVVMVDAGALTDARAVRKLGLAAEEHGTTVVLLTPRFSAQPSSRTSGPRAVPWPVALRLELDRRPEALGVSVAKDRRGRDTGKQVIRIAC